VASTSSARVARAPCRTGNWQLADALLHSGGAHVLSVCVEVCSAAMYLDDDPGVLISACLFGDGAGAAVLSRDPPPGRRRVAWRLSASSTLPHACEALRFEHRAGARDVLLALEDRLGLAPAQLRHSRDMLREYGNLSSAFVYFVLDASLEFVIALLCLRHDAAVPTMHLDEPDPDCDLDYLAGEARRGLGLRTVMSNSFAFGGTNAVLVAQAVAAQ